MSDYYIGLDWGGTRVKLGAVSETGQMLRREISDTPKDQAVADTVAELISRVRSLAESHAGNLKGVGLSLTGPVDPERGVALLPGKISGLEGYPIVPQFRQELGLPVIAENDGKLAMYAERYAGQARDRNWAVVLTIGTGVGSGVMVDGSIPDDPHFMFGTQVGHLVIDSSNDQLCLIGARGTAEMSCSATALALAVRSGIERGIPSTLTDDYHADPRRVTFHAVMERGVALDDHLCCDELRRWTAKLGWLLVNAIHAYSPEIVILSGGALLAADRFLPQVQQHVDQHIFRYPKGESVPIVASKIAEDAGVIGAALCCREKLAAKG